MAGGRMCDVSGKLLNGIKSMCVGSLGVEKVALTLDSNPLRRRLKFGEYGIRFILFSI